MSAFFGYKVVGLFQKIAADVVKFSYSGRCSSRILQISRILMATVLITPDDRVFIGNPNPKFTYGLNLAFTYKNFDLSAFLYGSYGADIFNSNRYFTDFWPSFQGEKSTDLFYNSWSPDQHRMQKLRLHPTRQTSHLTPRFAAIILKKDHIARLKNLELGYTIPESVMSKISMKSLRVYVQAVNLFTITKYSGLDPELGGDDRAFRF